MHNDLEFLDDPARAEDDAAPATVYEKPMSDEEDGAFNFDPPGIVFQSVYTMSLYGHLKVPECDVIMIII